MSSSNQTKKMDDVSFEALRNIVGEGYTRKNILEALKVIEISNDPLKNDCKTRSEMSKEKRIRTSTEEELNLGRLENGMVDLYLWRHPGEWVINIWGAGSRSISKRFSLGEEEEAKRIFKLIQDDFSASFVFSLGIIPE